MMNTKEIRNAREALKEAHQNSSRPAETVEKLANAIGYDAAQEIIATMIIAKGEWDQRISETSRVWAFSISSTTRGTLTARGVYYCDEIHPAHMDQIVSAMIEYQEPQEEQQQEQPAEISVDSLRDDLDLGEYGEYVNDYRDSSAYICDMITEIADSNTSIYYSDIMQFISENPEALADVIEEGLYDPSHGYDLHQHGQAAEFMTIERDLYNHLTDALHLAALDFIRYDLKRETIPEELAELLEQWADDPGERMDEIPDRIREYFQEREEEETE